MFITPPDISENTISIAGHEVGADQPTFIIAEVAQSHDGSLGMAHAFIEAAAMTGADAIKFQTHIAAAESTLDEPFRVSFSRQDTTRMDYWKRMEFTPEQWQGLAEHAGEKGLIFLSSAFSVEAVDMLRRIGMPAWKVGSGEFCSWDLMKAMADTGAPILFSTGMSFVEEIRAVVAWFHEIGAKFALFQCTSKYPIPLEEVGLNVVEQLRQEFHCPVGLSDHSGTIYPGLAAMARGAALLEVHVTFDRGMFGPDVPAAVTFEELAILCTARDAFAMMDGNPVDKNKIAGQLQHMRIMFGRSLAPVTMLSAGTELKPGMLISKKPAGGIAPEHAEKILGRRLARDVTPDRILRWEDLHEED
jgi:N-acetylneuraminate synthase